MRDLNRARRVLPSLLLTILASVVSAQDWMLRTPPVSPSAREGHAMAYDAARKRVVLFAGADGGQMLNDTWEWDGHTWTRCYPTRSPARRWYHRMAYDSVRQHVLLFSGVGGPNTLEEWDGVSWQTVPIVTPAPLYRWSYGMAYDSVRKKLVVYGGMNSPVTPLQDTWEWDSSAGWQQHYSPPYFPGGQTGCGMAFDAARGRVVMYGNHGVFPGTFEWDGSTWTGIKSPTLPPPHWGLTMAYDSVRRRVMVFGGDPYTNETFEWDGTNWTQHKPVTRPLGRRDHAMAYDVARDCLVVFGGRGITGLFGDTWEYGFPAAVVASGSPRPGGTVDLLLRTVNGAGLPYQAGSSLGTGPISIGKRQLGLSPDELLRVSVSNALPGIFSGYSGLLDGKGEAKAAVRIPKIPALVGTRVHTAFVTLDSKAPSGIRTISQSAMFTINP